MTAVGSPHGLTAQILYSIAKGCPLGESMPDCPLNRLRMANLEERLEFLRDLPGDLQEYLCSHHEACRKARISGMIVVSQAG